jgi:hypothetical protein
MISASTARLPRRAQLDHEAWAHVHATMARCYAGLDIVGWWISRPGPSAELDEAELVCAGESFARPSQFGFVFDSRRRRVALYGWRGGRYVRVREGPVPRRRDPGATHITWSRHDGDARAYQHLSVDLRSA